MSHQSWTIIKLRCHHLVYHFFKVFDNCVYRSLQELTEVCFLNNHWFMREVIRGLIMDSCFPFFLSRKTRPYELLQTTPMPVNALCACNRRQMLWDSSQSLGVDLVLIKVFASEDQVAWHQDELDMQVKIKLRSIKMILTCKWRSSCVVRVRCSIMPTRTQKNQTPTTSASRSSCVARVRCSIMPTRTQKNQTPTTSASRSNCVARVRCSIMPARTQKAQTPKTSASRSSCVARVRCSIMPTRTQKEPKTSASRSSCVARVRCSIIPTRSPKNPTPKTSASRSSCVARVRCSIMPTRTHPTQTQKRLQMSKNAKKQAAFYAPPANYYTTGFHIISEIEYEISTKQTHAAVWIPKLFDWPPVLQTSLAHNFHQSIENTSARLGPFQLIKLGAKRWQCVRRVVKVSSV